MDIRALVVDDSGIMRKMVMRTLMQAELGQFMFSEAQDGVDGLEKFEASKPDVIFVDWNMPNMNGLDFVRRVRAIQKKHIPIIMVTTESTISKVEEAMSQDGVDCFVIKPFTPEGLKVKVGPLMDKLKSPQKSPGFFGRLAAKLA